MSCLGGGLLLDFSEPLSLHLKGQSSHAQQNPPTPTHASDKDSLGPVLPGVIGDDWKMNGTSTGNDF